MRPTIFEVVARAAQSPFGPSLIFLVFAVFWIAVTTGLMAMAGWFACARRYADARAEPLAVFKGKSGSMGRGGLAGRVNMSGVLNFWLLPDGLRVGLNPLFGPFCRPFCVPWSDIRVRRWRFLGLVPRARLVFPVGAIDLDASLADRMARAAPSRWPETGSFPMESFTRSLAVVGLPWLLVTVTAATFLMIVPTLAGARAGPPPAVAILAPAIVYGAVAAGQLIEKRRP
jgi:hypothetical protein